jgi:uncharacterized membrane protein YgdD (TMEM256/DUF423 family)
MNLKSSRYLIVLAGIFGAAGVALSAAAAHQDLPGVSTAGTFLLFHAPALLALSLMPSNRLMKLAAWVLALGVALFCGDLTARAFLDTSLFPMAAPSGGVLMMAGWLGVAVSSLTQRTGADSGAA